MLTVPEAARRVGRDPETVRRWIRSGRLPAERVGTQHIVEERDLDALVDAADELPMPESWRKLPSGSPAPSPVAGLRAARRGR